MRVEALSNFDRRKPPLQTDRKVVKWRVVDYSKITKYRKTTIISVYGGIILDTDTKQIIKVIDFNC